jgi:hypothetical protein
MVAGSMMSQRMLTVVCSKNGSTTAGGRVERQDHVRLVDALPTRDGRAVEHLAVAKQVFIDEVSRGSLRVVLCRGCR